MYAGAQVHTYVVGSYILLKLFPFSNNSYCILYTDIKRLKKIIFCFSHVEQVKCFDNTHPKTNPIQMNWISNNKTGQTEGQTDRLTTKSRLLFENVFLLLYQGLFRTFRMINISFQFCFCVLQILRLRDYNCFGQVK